MVNSGEIGHVVSFPSRNTMQHLLFIESKVAIDSTQLVQSGWKEVAIQKPSSSLEEKPVMMNPNQAKKRKADMSRESEPPREDSSEIFPDCIDWNQMLFEKNLFPSDVGDFQRLSIPKKSALAHLPPLKPDDKGYKPNITFLDRQNNCWIMRYEQWSSGNYTLQRDWINFVKRHNVCANDTVQIFAHINHDANLQAGRYVYGIDFNKPSEPTLKLFGVDIKVCNKEKNDINGGDDEKFRPNGGNRRIRKKKSTS